MQGVCQTNPDTLAVSVR